MIVTGRARWLIVLCVAASVFGLYRQHVLLVRVALATLIWIGLEWVAFRYRADLYLRKAKIDRVVSDRQGAARVLWASRTARVKTTFTHPGGWLGHWSILPPIRATAHDLLPTGTVLAKGDNGSRFSLGQEARIDLSYSVRADAPGLVKFNGLRFVLEDLHGFFVAERFMYAPQSLRVLPLAMDVGTVTTIRKRANIMPPPGVHSVAKAGLGSELMEIREYQPGDPPRSIAWKVSARRDELMSKQFESEVPVRCQLLIDMSRSVRLGYPGPCLGGRLVSLASTIAFTLAANRDPVGVSMFDGQRVRIVQPSASRKAALQMTDQLCNALDVPIGPVDVSPNQLIRSGYDIARVRYPEALHHAELSLTSWWPSRAITRMRRRMAGILTNHYGLDQYSMGELEVNDQVMSYWLQRFHTDHGAPYTGELHDKDGTYLFDDRGKIDQLAKLLRRYSARGRDNELFVIFAELTDAEYDLSPLLEAIKYAKARHHRVALLLAWPLGMPTPSTNRVIRSEDPMIDKMLEHRRQHERSHAQLRSELVKLGVPVVAAADDSAPVLILNQLELIRSGRTMA